MIARGRVFAVPASGDPRIVVISVMVVVVALLVVRDRALMTIGVMQGTSGLCEQHITLKGLLSGSSRLLLTFLAPFAHVHVHTVQQGDGDG